MDLRLIEERIASVPNFPRPGILFRDMTPLLEDGKLFRACVLALAQLVPTVATKLVAIESRGFILASAMAQHLDAGVVLARKPGKLPRAVVSQEYQLEYGSDRLEIHADSLNTSDRVVIVDDVLATGGTAQAAENLIQKAQAHLLGSVFLMELKDLKGSRRLMGPHKSLLLF